MKKYYSLAVRVDGVWSSEFGDYDREVVKEELEDYKDHFHKSKDLKIVASGDKLVDIKAKFNELNTTGEVK